MDTTTLPTPRLKALAIVAAWHVRAVIGNRKPYQGVLYRGHELVPGERSKDLVRRHELIRPADLRGRTLLDIGCNIGTATFLAHESGAICEGWDISRQYIEIARRLAELFGYRVTFAACDVGSPGDLGDQRWDTCFAFSVARHGDILDIIERCDVVYFETNVRDNGRVPREIRRRWEMELVGQTSGGGRKVFRMVKK